MRTQTRPPPFAVMCRKGRGGKGRVGSTSEMASSSFVDVLVPHGETSRTNQQLTSPGSCWVTVLQDGHGMHSCDQQASSLGFISEPECGSISHFLFERSNAAISRKVRFYSCQLQAEEPTDRGALVVLRHVLVIALQATEQAFEFTHRLDPASTRSPRAPSRPENLGIEEWMIFRSTQG